MDMSQEDENLLKELDKVFKNVHKVDELDGAELDDEISVEIVEPYDSYPDSIYIQETPPSPVEQCASGGSDFSDAEELEVARGLGDDHLSMMCESFAQEENEGPVLTSSPPKAPSVDENIEKTRILLETFGKDGDFARSLPSLKLSVMNNGYFDSNEKFDQVFEQMLHNVNNRPRNVVLLNRDLEESYLENILQRMVESLKDQEVAIAHSMFRLYLKKIDYPLKTLSRTILKAVTQVEGAYVEYSDVYSSHQYNKSLRYKTSDIKEYWAKEETARKMKLKTLTSFDIRINGITSRDISIRWYDEPKSDGTRAQYMHIDHFAYPNGRLMFSDVRTETEIDIDDGLDMIETSKAFPPVYNLIEKLSIHESNKS